MKKRILAMVLALMVAFTMVPLACSACVMPCAVTPAVGVHKVVGGYTYHDWDGTDYKVTEYVVTIPKGTEKVTMRFAKDTCVYNYDVDGATYLDGYYEDATKGERKSVVSVDADKNGVLDVIHVQSPYTVDKDGNWSSIKLRYAVTFKYSDKTMSDYTKGFLNLVKKLFAIK